MMDLCKHCSDMMGGSWPMLGSKCTCGNRALPSAEQCEHGHLRRACEVCELKAEVARLRSVCREAGKDVRTVSYWGIVDWDKVRSIAADLEQAGKEATDGQ